MPSAILQLISTGRQDVYLTQEPTLDILKYNYNRYYNFANELVKLNLVELPRLGKSNHCYLENRGHLISKLYLHISLPSLQITSGTYASWCDALGYAIFDGPIELEIDGIVVDRIYPRFMEMWDELSNTDKRLSRSILTLKTDNYSAIKNNATRKVDLLIPLEFWFCKRRSMALPIVSMFNQTVKVNFKLKNFYDIINYDGATPPNYVDIIDSYLYCEYTYLDDSILTDFINKKHTYLIEQIQENESEYIESNKTIHMSYIRFNHPVKELVFALIPKQNLLTNNYFSYQDQNNLPILKEAGLLLDGKYRFDMMNEFIYRSFYPDTVHSTVPMRYIYCMPFSNNPEENQPSGTLNMSSFTDVILSMKLEPIQEPSELFLYGVTYNFLTIENGMFTVEFAV